jgi:hypothetical protein
MGRVIPLTNLEETQEYDPALVKQLAKIVKVLPILED